MSLEAVLALLIGGGGLGAFITAWLTRLSDKDAHELQLLDRAYKEIERLDAELLEERVENASFRKTLKEHDLL